MPKFGNFGANLVEFLVQKGHFLDHSVLLGFLRLTTVITEHIYAAFNYDKIFRGNSH